MQESFLDLVAHHEQAALKALSATTGGGSMCRVENADAKRDEGAAAAVADVRREAKRRPDDDPGVVVEDVLHRWSDDEGALAQRPGTESYRDGGLSALRRLAAALDNGGAHIQTTPIVSIRLDGDAQPQRRVWSARRIVVAVVLFVLWLVVLFSSTGGVVPHWGWLVFAVASMGLSAATLALFVPQAGAGTKLDIGCAPCALVPFIGAFAPLVALAYTGQVEYAVVAFALSGAALARKLTEPPACPTT